MPPPCSGRCVSLVSRDAPQRLNDLRRDAWSGVSKRTYKEYRADNLTDLAAALTYYGVLAIFPMLIVLVSILGLVGHSAAGALIETTRARHLRASLLQNTRGE